MQTINAFVSAVVNNYKTVKPEWHPPHKTIFKAARKYGFTARIDNLDEKAFNKKWWRLFEDGILEGEYIIVKLFKDRKKVAALKFESDDLREIHLK